MPSSATCRGRAARRKSRIYRKTPTDRSTSISVLLRPPARTRTGCPQPEREIRGDVPPLWPREVLLREEVGAARYREGGLAMKSSSRCSAAASRIAFAEPPHGPVEGRGRVAPRPSPARIQVCLLAGQPLVRALR